MNFTSVALAALEFAIQKLPLQQIATNVINSLIATSPLVNPAAPSTVTGQNPSTLLKGMQTVANSLDTTLPALKVDGFYGPKTEAKFAAVLVKFGVTIPTIA